MARRRNSRRSERRLGRQYPSSVQRVRFALAPLPGRWQAGASRLAAALLLMFAAWVIYAIFNSSNFYVYGINVQGNVTITNEEVYSTSGLEGLSIFWVNPAAVARQVETLSSVKSARVKVRLPARVTVTVQERTPVILWQTGDAQWWADIEGVIFPPRADLSNALTIIDADAQPVSPGETLDPAIIQTAQSLRQLLPELPEMNYSRATGISFTTGEGWPVYLGDGQDMDAKLTILVNLRKDLISRGITPDFIDVRYIERPFYK